MVLELISNDGRKFSEIVNEFEKYPASGEMNFMVPDIQSIMDKLQASHTDAVSVDTLDGLSVWYADWWFNVRASHTEPLLRLNVEANTKELLEEKTAILVEKLRKTVFIKRLSFRALMANLDDQRAMQKLDPKGVLASTAQFADQCEQAWREASAIEFPKQYQPIYNIVVAGMGGSRFTPRSIKELFRGQIREPYEIVDDYTLPGYVDSDTLVILSSFSGTTEEVLSCGQDAVKRGAKTHRYCEWWSHCKFS